MRGDAISRRPQEKPGAWRRDNRMGGAIRYGHKGREEVKEMVGVVGKAD